MSCHLDSCQSLVGVWPGCSGWSPSWTTSPHYSDHILHIQSCMPVYKHWSLWRFDNRILLHISDCQTAYIATCETQTTIYLVSSADVTAVARKPIETGEWHPRSLEVATRRARPAPVHVGCSRWSRQLTPGHKRESRCSARLRSWNIWTLSVSMIDKCVWEKNDYQCTTSPASSLTMPIWESEPVGARARDTHGYPLCIL
jgi:hypothetical protein